MLLYIVTIESDSQCRYIFCVYCDCVEVPTPLSIAILPLKSAAVKLKHFWAGEQNPNTTVLVDV